MAHRVLPGLALLVFVSATASMAFGQAAAESALTNSNSAAVGSKAGSAISKGLNQLNQKMGNTLSDVTKNPGSPTTQNPPAAGQMSSRTTYLPPEHKRPMGISIQDAGKKCPGEHPESEEAANADPNQVYTVCSPHDTNKQHVPSIYKYDKVVDITF